MRLRSNNSAAFSALAAIPAFTITWQSGSTKSFSTPESCDTSRSSGPPGLFSPVGGLGFALFPNAGTPWSVSSRRMGDPLGELVRPRRLWHLQSPWSVSTFRSGLICTKGSGADSISTISASPRIAGLVGETLASVKKPTGKVRFSNPCQLARANSKWERLHCVFQRKAHSTVTCLLGAATLAPLWFLGGVSVLCLELGLQFRGKDWACGSATAGITAFARRPLSMRLFRTSKMSGSGAWRVCSSSVSAYCASSNRWASCLRPQNMCNALCMLTGSPSIKISYVRSSGYAFPHRTTFARRISANWTDVSNGAFFKQAISDVTFAMLASVAYDYNK